jgi:hypothetical protein
MDVPVTTIAVVGVVAVVSLVASVGSVRFRSEAVAKDGKLTTWWIGFVVALPTAAGLAVLAAGIYNIIDVGPQDMNRALWIAFLIVALCTIYLVVGLLAVYLWAEVFEPVLDWAFRPAYRLRQKLQERSHRRCFLRDRSREAAKDARRTAAEEWDQRWRP